MGCYGCGSPEGDDSRLCPSCRVSRRAQRSGYGQSLGNEAPPDDLVHSVMQSDLVKVAAFVLLTIICFGFLMWRHSALTTVKPFAGVLLALIVSVTIVAVLTWLLMWVELIVEDWVWLIISAIIPIALYLHVLLNPGKIRKLFLFHVGCTLLSLAFTFLLAHELHIPFFQAYVAAALYLRGQDVAALRLMGTH